MSGTDAFFATLTVGSMTLANRFAMAPMTRSRSPGGVPGQNVVDYYRRRAEGGVGLIVTEGIGVDHPAALGSGGFDGDAVPVLHGEAALAGWRAVVQAVHAAGARIVPQLWHQGVMRAAGTGAHPDFPSSRPSGIWGPLTRRSTIMPEQIARLAPPIAPLGESEIADIVAAFARSAANAKAAGFDGIALHGAHGYLIDSFLWAETNLRTDRYGGDHAGRTRFAVEVVAAVRQAIGPGMPIILRFSQWKQQDLDAVLARSPRELEEILAPLSDAGVDVFDASTRDFRMPAFEGSDLNLAGWAKKLTGKLSMTVGGVGLDKDMYTSFAAGGSKPASLDALAERFARGEFDLVAVGRALIADSGFVQKLRSGAPREAFSASMLAELV